jgi:hypothetical protein
MVVNLKTLDGLQLQAVREGILDAYVDPADFAVTLRVRLNKNFLHFVSAKDNFEIQVYSLLEQFLARGWIDQLINAVEVDRPDNPRVAGLRVTLGLLAPKPPPGAQGIAALERLLCDASPHIDFGRWIADLMALQARVCRIESQFFGTGFLVATDLVLTNHHVVASEIATPRLAKDLICRFDYSSTDGSSVRRGREVGLDTNWQIPHRTAAEGDTSSTGRPPQPDQLDYALLRLAESVGEDAAGSTSRGAFKLRREPIEPKENAVIQIVQHPRAGPLAMSTGTILEYDAQRLRVRYVANTEAGSSGSPVLAPDLSVVALHHAGGPDWGNGRGYNQGIPMGRILRDLETKADIPRFWT